MSIVIGHDGGQSGDDAAALGAQLALTTGETPIIVAVYPEENPIGIGRVDAEWVAYMRQQADEVAAHARRFLEGRGVQAEYRVVGSTSAAHGLNDVAEAEEATVIVVGSTPRGARRRISPGSTGDRLLHGAICPVAVAPRGMHERPPDTPIRRVGVAYVDSPESREALRSAGEWAAATSATLTLYTVVAPRAEVFAPVIGRDAELSFLANVRESAHKAQAEALASLPEAVSATAELLEGDVVDELASLDEHEIDVLVCGSRGYGPVRRVLLGGVARNLSRRAACPLVVVPRGTA